MSTKPETKSPKRASDTRKQTHHHPQAQQPQQQQSSTQHRTSVRTNPLTNSNKSVNATAKTSSPAKVSRNQVSANWNSLASTIVQQRTMPSSKKIGYLSKHGAIALDCEMVGIGPNGRDHMLARVSIVNENGDIILDRYVKPTQPVVDYRTKYSGITPTHLESAHSFAEVQAEVLRIKLNRILVGHALHNDFRVLKIEHPKRLIRDTSMYRKCREISEGTTPALRLLANCILKYDIQTGSHCSIEDARATMAIYQRFAKSWERSMAKYF